MRHYIKPKFKIGQRLYSVGDDKIHSIIVESILITTCKEISYLSENRTYLESQSFLSEAEAIEFLSEAFVMPFVTGNKAWEADRRGVSSVNVRGGNLWFNEKKKTPYNSQITTDSVLNSTSVYGTRLEAAKECLSMMEREVEREVERADKNKKN